MDSNIKKNTRLQNDDTLCNFALPLILMATFSPCKRTGMNTMAKDCAGRKFNRIPEHERYHNGKVIHVKAHIRSNRCDCKGKK